MSSERLERKYPEIMENSFEGDTKEDIDISQLIIPFSKLSRRYTVPDVYSGKEKIPFKERDPEYKMIFRQEFANFLNDNFKIYKPVVRFPSF